MKKALVMILIVLAVLSVGASFAQEARLDTVTYCLGSNISYIGFIVKPESSDDIFSTVPGLLKAAVWDRYSQNFIEIPPGSTMMAYYATHCSGFFLFMDRARMVQIIGHPIDCATVDVSPGWNSITAPKGSSLVHDPGNIITAVWQWVPDRWYEPAQDRYIFQCYGAWVWAVEAGTISLGPKMFPPNTPGGYLAKNLSTDYPPLPWGLTPPDVANDPGVKNTTIPGKFGLAQNYPNPFNPTTTIKFTIPENSGRVKLTVFDINGRTVARLVDGTMPAGEYEAPFNAFDLPSGSYFCRLDAGGYSNIKRMTLVK